MGKLTTTMFWTELYLKKRCHPAKCLLDILILFLFLLLHVNSFHGMPYVQSSYLQMDQTTFQTSCSPSMTAINILNLTSKELLVLREYLV